MGSLAISIVSFLHIVDLSGSMRSPAKRQMSLWQRTGARCSLALFPKRLSKSGSGAPCPVKTLSDKFALYGADFNKLVGFRRELDKVSKEVLDPIGLKLRTDLEELQGLNVESGTANFYALVGEALKQVMMARLNVNKVLGRHDDASAQNAMKAFADLKSVMDEIAGVAKAGRAGKLTGEIKALTGAYQQAFESASRNAHEIKVLVDGEMKKFAEEIAENAQSVKTTGIVDEQQIELETEGLIRSTRQLVLMLALGGVVLGIALAWLVGRGISIPVRKMETSCSNLPMETRTSTCPIWIGETKSVTTHVPLKRSRKIFSVSSRSRRNKEELKRKMRSNVGGTCISSLTTLREPSETL